MIIESNKINFENYVLIVFFLKKSGYYLFMNGKMWMLGSLNYFCGIIDI